MKVPMAVVTRPSSLQRLASRREIVKGEEEEKHKKEAAGSGDGDEEGTGS